MSRYRLWCAVFVVSLALAGAGCGGADKPISVRGTVTLGDKPLAGATVVFIPDGDKGRQANGTTGKDGSFQLTTFKPDDGALAGNYKVVVQHASGVEAPPAANMRDAMKGQADAVKKTRPPASDVPAQYSDPGKTPLKQKVPPDGPVQIKLDSK